ncbi:MAG: PP2C family serine/threonine-protein phosphatase [Luteibacter sp.]|uniref:PP2C family protein-serine/threonine phosphatase n=1 Tax=Rhodanobacteraceae TaxID=1775411 RepID=UPI0005649568|nr:MULTISPECIES: PP2C family serine/threonine-protein phosphatase [Rhodanobacteraceae]MDQ7997108.1 serine/threonine-protein phosphatase [Luteibacter sp.]MDQ8049758.1 serine/threonine-protein phosphatase [Luteibacter sp.]SDG77379.1 protein phosphatase [Dyella sp. 333MFSha]SKB43202.1 protein phosphatase [Luteibacter sp. 22Crub2.1]
MSMPYVSAGRTETGHVRRHNEDAILVAEERGLWAVADGLGGHSAGDVASSLITERLRALPLAHDVTDTMDAVEDELLRINQRLRALASDRRVDAVASTVVVLVHTRDLVVVGWVGDSRAYAFEDGRLWQVTHDHVHGDRADETRFGAQTAQKNAGALTRAVGAEDHLFVDWVVHPRRPGTCFVLCSDGINKELTDAEIEVHCRRHSDPAGLIDALVGTALNRAGRDNVSAVAIRLDDYEESHP